MGLFQVKGYCELGAERSGLLRFVSVQSLFVCIICVYIRYFYRHFGESQSDGLKVELGTYVR